MATPEGEAETDEYQQPNESNAQPPPQEEHPKAPNAELSTDVDQCQPVESDVQRNIQDTLKSIPNEHENGGYYQTNVQRQDFQFRLTPAIAAGLACGPSNRVFLHHVVYKEDHPAAVLSLPEDVAALTVLKLIECGVDVKIDNQMEQSLRSMVDPDELKSARLLLLSRHEVPNAGEHCVSPEEIEKLRLEKYEVFAKAFRSYPNLKEEPEKMYSLKTLQDAIANKKHIPLNEMQKIVREYSSITTLDREQVKRLVERLIKVQAVSEHQPGEIFKGLEPSFKNDKIPMHVFNRVVEDHGGKREAK